jgi:hypothetical protein
VRCANARAKRKNRESNEKVSGTLLCIERKRPEKCLSLFALRVFGTVAASAHVLSVLVPRSASALHKCGARPPVPNEKSEVKGKKCLAL